MQSAANSLRGKGQKYFKIPPNMKEIGPFQYMACNSEEVANANISNH